MTSPNYPGRLVYLVDVNVGDIHWDVDGGRLQRESGQGALDNVTRNKRSI